MTAPDGEPTQTDETASENRLYRFLENRVFRVIIDYTIHPLHIQALLFLWIGLLVFHGTTFELVGGNYTNGLSAMAASIVLLQQTRHQREVRRMTREHGAALREIRHLLGHGGGKTDPTP